jgi:hypothetical protein
MKKILTFLFLTVSTGVFAQDTLNYFNYARSNYTTAGMEVLGSWGVVNVGIGAAGWANSRGGSNKYFYKMTTIWGATNVAASLLGYLQNNKSTRLNAAETLREQKKIERTFLINAGLDVVSIGTGIFLKTRGDNRNSDQLRGYGSAIIVQGVFLLLFDGTMYGTHRYNGNQLRQFLERHPITFNGKTVGMIYYM